MYERDHLRREIAKTKAFDYIYQDIALHPLHEFQSMVAENNAKRKREGDSDVDAMDRDDDDNNDNNNNNTDLSNSANEHELMLNRLRFELRERKRLKADQDALVAIKQRLLKENEMKKLELDTLDKDLESLVKASLPLQERLGVLVSRKRDECLEAQNLARPLFVLYQEVLTWNDLNPADSILIEIVGRDSSASMEVDRANKADSNGAPSHSANPSNQRNETSLRLQFYTESSQKTSIVLNFFYLPKLGLTIVELPTLNPSSAAHSPLKSTFSLMNLLPDDNGLESPNPANNNSRNSSKVFSVKESGGFAYHWLQRLSGVVFPHLLPLPDGLSTGLFEFILMAIRRRATVLEEIREALRHVVEARKDVLRSKRADKTLGGKVLARVVGWKDIVDEDNQTCINGMITIECQKHKFVFACELACTYPNTAAKFSFVEHRGADGGDSSPESVESINDLLHAVNNAPQSELIAHYDNSGSESGGLLALYQLSKLVACVGFLVEGGNSFNGYY
ncbi:Fms-interacting protein-domain-containing protein [Obelidium mucronatum]|nr:Fms-interacting protein-domain-containing protein [Obelidium mucronatum]